MFFSDRREAGRQLARVVASRGDFSSWDIVEIARGGVIIANEIAMTLGAVPKAICAEDTRIYGKTILVATSLGSGTVFNSVVDGNPGEFIGQIREIKELKGFIDDIDAKHDRLIGLEPRTYGKKILLCDDGIVSGRSVMATINSLRDAGTEEIVVAIPVVLQWVSRQKDFPFITWRVTTMTRPATGIFYRSFEDTPDQEVFLALNRSPSQNT